MKISNLRQTGEKVSFSIKGLDLQLANAFRRLIISGVPVMAIERITFYDNTSIMNDEIMANRLGLIPLKTDLKTYRMISECTCKGKGCGKCTAIITMDVKGPKTVYSTDLKSTDPKVVPVYKTIPIVKLTEKQSIKFEAVAQLGIGKEHIKWQAGLASYEQTDDDSFNFIVESYGQLGVKELVKTTFDTFEKQIEDLSSKLK